MAGIGDRMGQQAPQQQAARQGVQDGVQQPDASDEGEGVKPPASPEEQEEYENVMSKALKVIYPEGEGEGQPSPNVLKALQGSDNPVMNLATAAVSIIQGLRQSAQEGGEVDRWNQIAQQGDLLDFDDILFNVGEAVVSELAELAEAAKINEYSEEDIERAFYIGLDMYRQQGEQSGAVNPAALKAAWGQAVEANNNGTLDQLMPGAKSRMKATSEPQQEEA